jgi:hypothetical protein
MIKELRSKQEVCIANQFFFLQDAWTVKGRLIKKPVCLFVGNRGVEIIGDKRL